MVRHTGWRLVLLLLVGVVGVVDANTDSRLVDAVKRGDQDAVRVLVAEHVDVGVPEADGSTPLHWAVYRDGLEIARVLVRAGAAVTAANRYGVQPLAC